MPIPMQRKFYKNSKNITKKYPKTTQNNILSKFDGCKLEIKHRKDYKITHTKTYM